MVAGVDRQARLRQYELDDQPGELETMQAMEIAPMSGDSGPSRRPRRRRSPIH